MTWSSGEAAAGSWPADDGLGCAGQILLVPAQASVAAQPSEQALNHPSPRTTAKRGTTEGSAPANASEFEFAINVSRMN
jgi:hypothetical protein